MMQNLLIYDSNVGIFIRDICTEKLYPVEIPIDISLLDIVYESDTSPEGDVVITVLEGTSLLINVNEKRLKAIFGTENLPKENKIEQVLFLRDTIVVLYSKVARRRLIYHFFDYSGKPYPHTAFGDRLVEVHHNRRFRKLLCVDLLNTLHVCSEWGHVLARHEGVQVGHKWHLASVGEPSAYGGNDSTQRILWTRNRYHKDGDGSIVVNSAFEYVHIPQLRLFAWARLFYALHEKYNIPRNLLNSIFIQYIKDIWNQER